MELVGWIPQAYSNGISAFQSPPWMQVMIRDIHDPLGWAETAQAPTGVTSITYKSSKPG